LGTLGFLYSGHSRLRIVLLGWGLAAGILSCAVQEEFVLQPAEMLSGQTLTVNAEVLEYPEVYEDYARVTVRLSEPGLPRVKCQIMDYDGLLGEMAPGDELRCTLRFRSARVRYGGESDMYTSRGVFIRATLCSETAVRPGADLRSAPLRLSRFVRERSRELFPADTAPFHTALLSGNKTALYNDLDTYYALSRAGLMHVTAVSGMHVSFLVGFVLLLFPNRRRSALFLQPLLLLFAAMTGFTPSVMRAVFMQFCLLLAPLLKRESDSLTSLSLILAVLLLINPQAAASVSLQLSFAATLGIVLFAPAIMAKSRHFFMPLGRKISNFLSASLAVSLGALALTTPLTALHFGYVSLLSPLSNALCLWLISLLFVGGYAVVVMSVLWPAGAAAAAWVLAWGDRFVIRAASLISSIPNACLYMENKSLWLWLGFVYALAFYCWLYSRRKGEARLTAPVTLAVIGLCICLLLPYRNRDVLCASVLDVGQGSCVLLEGGSNAVIVDCGGRYSDVHPGEVAANYLLSRQRHRLDALILTHLHADHINGVEKLLALVDVEAIYLPEWPEDENYRILRDIAAERGVELFCVREDLLLLADGWELEVTAPLGSSEEYENGLFVRACQGDYDVLIGGDATASLERRYLQHSAVSDIDVLVVNHHGSKTATSEWALRRLKPKEALISVGYNTYGHPHEDVLERLYEVGAAVYRTDENGHLVVSGKE